MNNKINVINHIPCIEQLEKMHTKLAIKETEMLDHINTTEDFKKEIDRLNLLLKSYQGIINYLNKYNIYNENDLCVFFNKYNIKYIEENKENKNQSDNSSYESDEDIEFECINDICDEKVTVEGDYCGDCKKDLQNCRNCHEVFWTDIINRHICYKCCEDDYDLDEHDIDENLDSVQKIIQEKVFKENINHDINNNISNVDIEIPRVIPKVIYKFKNIVNKIILINKIKKMFLDSKKNEELDSVQKIIHKNVKEKEKINVTSLKTFERIKQNYYNHHDELLPEIKNPDINKDFETINKYIKDKCLIGIYVILQFYIVFVKYLDKNGIEKTSQSSFIDFIKYDKDINKNKYNINQLYNKCKRCYEFIKVFKQKDIDNKQIIELLYKSKINYSSLYKIKGNDYENLKNFFLDKIILVENNNHDANIKINEITIKTKHDNIDRIFNYTGNKNNLIDTIKDHVKIDNHDVTIYDLFAGSMSIPYHLKKQFPDINIVSNDINEYLYDFYKTLQNQKEILLSKIKELNNIEQFKNYKELLDIFNNSNDKILKSAILFIVNKISFNNSMYFDKNKKLNISINKRYYEKTIIIDETVFDEFHIILNKIEINNHDILDNTELWVSRIKKDDIVIIDSPYHIVNNNCKRYINNFNNQNHEDLFKFIEKLHIKGAKLLVFNSDTLYINDLYKKYHKDIIYSYKSINRKYYKEILFYN